MATSDYASSSTARAISRCTFALRDRLRSSYVASTQVCEVCEAPLHLLTSRDGSFRCMVCFAPWLNCCIIAEEHIDDVRSYWRRNRRPVMVVMKELPFVTVQDLVAWRSFLEHKGVM